ncbi:uncharacterized protein FSUBG_1122 [Fusarium subglutinans]|uniref:Uncharacterized protein n=1 Tax=Gibberella subglutinans TaxID=42677 RepID=A0A8H5QE93_GIBSU|nr:uncharacterized protein FSUBG_1122 [Fusarium subglutinans]KAF5612892.1 hypothetical protein FSUBG_1122 [Fusarium subglutinans]
MNSRPTSRGDTPSASGSRPGSKAGSLLRTETIDSRIESPAGMFGSPDDYRLPDISETRSTDTGYFSPDPRLSGEQSIQPSQSPERNMEAQEARPVSSPQAVNQSLRELVDSRIVSPAGMFGGPADLQLFSIKEFRSPIAGYFSRDFNLQGPQFLEKVHDQREKMDDVKARYEDLWLSTQLFWDLMLRMQPNCVTSDIGVLRTAVDLMLDVVVGRMLPQLRPEYHPILAESHLQALSRRLRALELRLRTDMGTCGKSPKMLCGCVVPVKRPNNKDKLWTRHLIIRKDEKGRPEDRGLKFRDLAGLLRLEDFLSHVYNEFKPQLSPGSPAANCGIIHTAIALMDDDVKRFIPKKDYNTADELKAEWVYVLCHGNFRSSIALEVMGIVNDAVAFSEKDGTQAHREECDLWAPKTVPEPLTTSARFKKLTTFRPDQNRGTSPLHPSYWKRDS